MPRVFLHTRPLGGLLVLEDPFMRGIYQAYGMDYNLLYQNYVDYVGVVN